MTEIPVTSEAPPLNEPDIDAGQQGHRLADALADIARDCNSPDDLLNEIGSICPHADAADLYDAANLLRDAAELLDQAADAIECEDEEERAARLGYPGEEDPGEEVTS